MEPGKAIQRAENRLYIDTFAGCGGSALGLRNSGWHGLFAIEKDPMAFETLQRNFLDEEATYPHFGEWPDWFPQQPQTVESVLDDKSLRDKIRGISDNVSLIIGGPPCQGFSIGGARDGRDERNGLVFELLDLARLVQPPFVVVENVEGITKRFVSKSGELKESPALTVCRELAEIGYSPGFVVVNTADFGVPQIRKRVIILGISGNLFPGVDVQKLLSHVLPKVAREQKDELGLHAERYVSSWQALHDLSGTELTTCPDAPKFNTAYYLPAQSDYAQMMREGIPDGEIPNSHRFPKHGDRVRNLYKKAHETQPPGRLSKDFLISNGTKTNKKFLLDPEQPSSTLTTHPDETIHYLHPRNITIREMARFQSFPDRFWFYGRYTLNGPRRKFDVSRCAQVGNAIPPFLGRAIGKALDEIINMAKDGTIKRFNGSGIHQFEQMDLFESTRS